MTQALVPLPNPPAPVAPPIARRRKRWPLYIGGAFVVLMLFGGVGFVTASILEEHDSFCISCHTVPETTYFNRAYLAVDNPTLPVNDLSSAHYHLVTETVTGTSTGDKVAVKKAFGCIDCHRGDGSLGHRVSTLVLAGRDAVTYVTGHENPDTEKTDIREAWLPNAACVTCHTETLLNIKGLDNHFHSLLPQAGEALRKGGKLTVSDVLKGNEGAVREWSHTVDNAPLTCTSCHLAHTTITNGKANFYMQTARRNTACVSCHVAAGKGPQDAASIGN